MTEPDPSPRSLIQGWPLESTMKSHNKQLYRVSCFTLSASLWMLFGLSL
ncbi:MAG: hypothetical protein RLZZ597_827 [Cyanobacteriota bacterium]|jgi:hypothetical protein